MKKLAAFAAMIAIVSVAQAQPEKLLIKVAKPLVLNYLEATGCPDDVVDPKLVSRFSHAPDNLDGYVAVVSSDTGCLGGSGTSAPTLVFLRTAEGREGIDDPSFSYLKVDPLLSEPVARSNGLPRALTSIYQKDGQLFATGLVHGKDDANCCPSVKTLHKITLVKKGVSVGKDDTRYFYTWDVSQVKK